MTIELVVIIDPQIDFINKEGVDAKKHSGINKILDTKKKITKI